MDVFDIDAYSPAQMAARVEKAGITKGNLDPLSTLVLAMLAGAFIAFGAALYTFVLHDTTLTLGLSRLLGGLVFCLGLILVIVAGAELFTGNNLIVMAYVSRKVTGRQLLQNWAIVLLGNLLGALIIVVFIYLSNHLKTAGGALSLFALKIAVNKVNLTFIEALMRGILCNLLVCLAVWLCFSGRSVTDKILAILFPITAFVAMGFEHCVANMYFIPVGLVIANDNALLESAMKLATQPLATDSLTIGAFLWNNLIPVTLGNMIGGVFFVGAVYWFVYLRRSAAEPLRNIMTKGPPAIAPETPIAEAVRVMQAHNSSSVLVGKLGESLGIVGEADIVKKAVAQGMNPDTTPVSAIMSAPLISVDIKTTIYGVYRLLAERRIRHVVITEAGKQVGFISVKDLLRRPLI
jgi:formate/nitrite transporter